MPFSVKISELVNHHPNPTKKMKSIFAVAFVFIYVMLIASITVSLYIFLQWKTDLGLILLGVNGYIFIRVTKLAINQH